MHEASEALLARRYAADFAWLARAEPLMSRAYWQAHGFHGATPPAESGATLPPDAPLQGKVGRHFEQVHDLALAAQAGVELLANQRPLRAEGQTLGELDAVYRLEGRVIHREIAVKYYLGVEDSDAHTSWWGPSKRDRLDLKLKRMRTHQLRLPEIAGEHWPEDLPLPELSEVLLLGALFRRAEFGALPAGANPALECGRWCYRSEVGELAVAGSTWAVLRKPWWLSPEHASLAEALSPAQLGAYLDEHRHPVLVGRVDTTEVERAFVVPDGWWVDAGETAWRGG